MLDRDEKEKGGKQERSLEIDGPIWIHAFTNVKLVILEVGKDFLGGFLSFFFEGLHPIGVGLSKVSLDCFHVTFEIGHVGLLVE